ncbi:ACT domain-containing protein [Leifsonia sp. ku-ls]|nr:ACT domain-containing protein [Leifsonia sp. ku-ls]
MSAADHQTLRLLDGRYVLERLTADTPDGDVLATVQGPDGGARMRRHDAAPSDAWIALRNGDAAHPPEATGMLAAIVGPLSAGGVPVWTAASYDGDIVLVPQDRFDEARTLLRDAGHTVR